MKKSELYKSIRETILNKLAETATQDDVDNQVKYNDELEKTQQIQKDMGMAESKDSK